MMTAPGFAKRLSRDQLIVLASIVAILALAWLYLVATARDMTDMAEMLDMMPEMAGGPGMAMMMTPQTAFSAAPLALNATMWFVMMLGMMLPSAVPMILLFAAVQRRQQSSAPFVATAVFVAGYFLIWGGFSLVATAGQAGLVKMSLLGNDLSMTSALLGGALFVAAGAYEWSPLKRRCLSHCQSPMSFVVGHWRPGAAGALRMGAEHGLYCLGCCWVLMLLLLTVGVMNLLWVAALTVLVLLQKLLPGRVFSAATGTAMVAFGLFLIDQALVA
jgi:predicted metal-binding membrane protein